MIFSIHSQRLRQVTLRPYLQLCVAIPVLEVPEGAVPAAQCRPELLGNCLHLRAAHNRDDHPVFHDHIVHGNEESRPFDWIEFTFGRMKEVVVRFVVPAGGITTLPFVFLGRNFLMTGIVASTLQDREAYRHPTYTSRYLHRTCGQYQDLPHRRGNKLMPLST